MVRTTLREVEDEDPWVVVFENRTVVVFGNWAAAEPTKARADTTMAVLIVI